MIKKWLKSCQLLNCLPKVGRNIISKEGLLVFILNFVFLQNNCVVVRVKKANSLQMLVMYVYHVYFLLLQEQMCFYKTCPVSVSQVMNTAH